MDWIELQRNMMFPAGLSARSRRLLALERVLDGTLYDHISGPFYRSCNADGTYIPIHRRRPSVRTSLCNIVVEDSAALLFSASHWPLVSARHVDGGDDREREAIFQEIITNTHLPSLMEQAAVMGSVGSIAVLIQALDGDLVIELKRTCYLQPVFSLLDPRRLESVRERYLVDDQELHATGLGDFAPGSYWFIRDYLPNETIWYQPVPASFQGDADFTLIRDEHHSFHHGLGVVPIVWIKNLPAMDPLVPDGRCTFTTGIDAMLDADYLLSQTVRGLRYSADPTMVFSGDDFKIPGLDQGPIPKDPSRAITIPSGGDAKLLEINGTGAEASLKMWQALRELALEAMHGNRSHGDKLSAAQSGKAMEMMCKGLTWLTGRLRRSYGEFGLIEILRLICRYTQIFPDIAIGGRVYGAIDASNLSLIWPPWFEPTFADMQTLSQAVMSARQANAISRDTAVAMMRSATRVPHAEKEREKIINDILDHDARIRALNGATDNPDNIEV